MNYKPYEDSIEDVVNYYETDLVKGLSQAESQERLERYGRNELEEQAGTTLLQKFIAQFKDFMIIILLLAALVSFFVTKEASDALIILLVVILNAIMGVYQEAKAEESINALQEMSSPEARVRRDGNVQVIKSHDIVPGDIILLEAGDVVPADARIIVSNSLKIEEAALTGESVPVSKNAEPLKSDDHGIGDRHNMVFSSTNVTYGQGEALVTDTGMDTEIGHIATLLDQAETSLTPLQRDQDRLGKVLTVAILIIAVITFVVGLMRGREWTDMLLISISLAVAAIPEGLPAISTIILSLGSQTMSERNALVRTLPAVETLGATDIIASDKTGTLTANQMTVEKIYTDGLLFDRSEELSSDASLLRIMTFANDTKIGANGELIGDPTETALVEYALHQDYPLQDVLAQEPRVAEIPFDSERKLMTTVQELPNGKFLVAVKGAPDMLLEKTNRLEIEGEVVELTPDTAQTINANNEAMAKEALRVLAAGYKVLDELPEEITSDILETDLIFAGLMGMIDPERPEAKESIAVARQAGIRTIMITGDHALTAQAIAERLNILDPQADNNETHVMTGAHLNQMSQEELEDHVEDYSVYARVSPEHKVRIIRAWQAKGKTIAMTGDGVNDAPSLKQADIGVGMGITGTEVSKGASDIVLADDNFETIVVAVEEGRKVFANIQKAVQFLLSANLGEVLILFIATLLGWQILEPVHILWINVVTDVFPAIALGMEPTEKAAMNRPPRSQRSNFLSNGVLPSIAYQGVLEALLTLGIYWYAVVYQGWDNKLGETMAFVTLGLIQLFHSYNVKSVFQSLFSDNPFKNTYLNWANLLSGSLLLAVVLVPGINTYFNVTLPNLQQWGIIVFAAASIILLVEIFKGILRASGLAEKLQNLD